MRFFGYSSGCGAQDADGRDIFKALTDLDESGKLTRADLKPIKNMVFLTRRDGKVDGLEGGYILSGAGMVLARFDGTPRLERSPTSVATGSPRTPTRDSAG